jgi:hypothetical protein
VSEEREPSLQSRRQRVEDPVRQFRNTADRGFLPPVLAAGVLESQYTDRRCQFSRQSPELGGRSARVREADHGYRTGFGFVEMASPQCALVGQFGHGRSLRLIVHYGAMLARFRPRRRAPARRESLSARIARQKVPLLGLRRPGTAAAQCSAATTLTCLM